jgi:hypothetical protein
MTKKPSKHKANKRPTKKSRRVIIDDPAMPLLSGIEAVIPKRPKRPTAAEAKAWRRTKAMWLERERLASAAREAAMAARLAKRPDIMQDEDYRLPKDVESFVRSLFRPDEIRAHGYSFNGLDEIAGFSGVEHAYLSAYMEGCRQGYIEGRVADLEPKRRRAAKANAAKRRKRQDCGGRMMTLDERDAAIVAEFPTLRGMLGSIEAQLRLAEKYGLQSREQVGNIVRKARRNGTA